MPVNVSYRHARGNLADLWDEVEDSRAAAVIERRGRASANRKQSCRTSSSRISDNWGDTNRKTALRVLQTRYHDG